MTVMVAASGAYAGGQGASAGKPRCFGAASRDKRKPCHNARLRFMVRPRPSVAQITPNAPCERLERPSKEVHPCVFGVPPGDAVATLALMGDSHASHWRAAVHEVALARRWYGINVTNGICPLSAAERVESAGPGCRRWKAEVIRWLTDHPEITIVVHAQINSGAEVRARPGESQFEASVSGYRRFWRRFPPSVEHVVVMRDNPAATTATPRCVMRARAQRRSPGQACALARSSVLRPDPLAGAARRSDLPEVRLADLTRFFCDGRLCYPVVGGALVHKDMNHLTRVFAATLGPYLLRRFDRFVPRAD